jgi:hypothetical protein
VQFLADDVVVRACTSVSASDSGDKDFKGQQEQPAGRQSDDFFLAAYYCKSDLCNGSGRLAEMSTMMILVPASLVLFISFFSSL